MKNLEKISNREFQLRSILTRIVAEPGLKRVLDLILKNGAKFLNMDSGGIILYHEATPDKFSYYIAMNIPAPYMTRIITEKGGLISQVISQKTPAILKDFTSDAPFAKMWHGLGFKVVIVAPLIYHDELVGLIHLGSTDPQRRIDPFEEESLQIYAEYAGIAIYIARMVEELRKHRDHLEEIVAERTAELKRTNEQLQQEITERKKAEEEREVLIKVLEDSRRAIMNVAEDLRQSKQVLENQKKALEEINKELDDFTYIVSHDLREPLRSINAFSKFIKDDCKDRFDEEDRNYLERIRVNANRMEALIEDLLEISRIERRKDVLEEVESEELVNEAKLRLEYAVKQKNAEIIIRDKLPRIFCDRVRFTAVFLNLISNAIKFADKKPLIEIGCGQKNGVYEFYVKDNGPGIEEQYFNKIFEIFQRLGRRQDKEGTGAGLTIVKKIIQMHKGKIWVESKMGRGTTFYFTIPKERGNILGKRKIGQILIEKKLVAKEDTQKALDEQERG